jgi:DNA-binding SARP family transcriptional activator
VTALRFRILGTVEFHDGARWTTVGSAKQRALLAALLLNTNQVVGADRLISELWVDRAPASAAGLLAGYVWRLRQAIGDPGGHILVTKAPGYQLTVPPTTLDVHEYDTLVTTGRAKLAAGDLAAATDAFAAALAMWRDMPLADVPVTPTVMAERARLEESQLAVLETRMGAEIELGRHEALLPELKQLVSQHPLRERLHSHLMVALYRCGQQADALGAYRDLRRLLINELGIEPSKPLRELQQRILREDPGILGPTPQPSAAPALPLQVGRALADMFPDGQFYVRGSAEDALRYMATDGRRVLVVVDDVDSGNAAPKPPPGCAVLLVGRHPTS